MTTAEALVSSVGLSILTVSASEKSIKCGGTMKIKIKTLTCRWCEAGVGDFMMLPLSAVWKCHNHRSALKVQLSKLDDQETQSI